MLCNTFIPHYNIQLFVDHIRAMIVWISLAQIIWHNGMHAAHIKISVTAPVAIFNYKWPKTQQIFMELMGFGYIIVTVTSVVSSLVILFQTPNDETKMNKMHVLHWRTIIIIGDAIFIIAVFSDVAQILVYNGILSLAIEAAHEKKSVANAENEIYRQTGLLLREQHKRH